MTIGQVIYSLVRNYSYYQIDDELIDKLVDYHKFNNTEFRNRLEKAYKKKRQKENKELLSIKEE